MTKEITKAIILQEIQDKLKLREFAPTKFLFDETVVPVYNIERHLQKWTLDYKRVSIDSAAAFTFFTVPENEQWQLRSYNVIFLGAGAIKVAGIYITRNISPSNYLYLDLTKNQTVSYAVELNTPVVLDPGSMIRVMCDDYISTQNLDCTIDVMKEEIR